MSEANNGADAPEPQIVVAEFFRNNDPINAGEKYQWRQGAEVSDLISVTLKRDGEVVTVTKVTEK